MKNLKIEQQKGSKVVISGELPWDDFKVFRPKALGKINEIITIDGFRKGHIPEDILVKNAGENAILEEMANFAFQKLYPEILKENSIDAIGRPEIQITKLAKDNPLGFVITTSVLPEVTLPDYKKIALVVNKTKKETVVTPEDIEKTIEEIRTMRAKQDLFKKMQEGKNGHVHDEHCNHDKEEIENNKDESVEDIQKRIDEKLELPECNDEFVKSLGDFKDVEDFKIKLTENLTFEKTRKNNDKLRVDIIEGILKEMDFELPDIIVESEIQQIIHAMQSDVAQMGMKFEDYLKNLGKTEEDIRKDVTPDAQKRAKIQVVVGSIAKQEKFIPNEEAVQKEIENIKKHYPDANEDSARNYVESILMNDLVFKMLESQ